MRVLTAVFGLALCGAAQAAGTNPNATLTYYDAVSNQTLDPREPQNNSSFAQGPLMAVYDALVYLDPKGEPKPGLALSWTYNPDLTEIVLKLRPNVTFHDGAKFDAAAVARNLEVATALGLRAGFAVSETMSHIAGVDIQGEDTVRLKLKQPNGQMPYLLGSQAGMMISPQSLQGDGFGNTLKPLGAGPYKVRSFDSNVKTVADRYDQYWGGPAGRPATIVHQFVNDGRARLNALRSGQANLALIDPRQIAEAKGAGFEVLVNEKNSTWDFYLNVKRENIGNLKVRQAFMHALDRAAIADALGFGASKPTAQLFASSSPAFVPELEALYPYDPAKAKKLLAEGGYPNGVDVTWVLLNTTEYKQLAEAMQAMLAEVGIRIKFDIVDTSQYVTFRRPPTRGDIMMARWGGRPDPLQAFQEVAATGGSVNAGDAASPEIDALVDKARRLDPANPERMKVIHQLGRLTTELVSHFGVMTRSAVYAYKPGCIAGLPPYLPTGNDRINDVTIAEILQMRALPLLLSLLCAAVPARAAEEAADPTATLTYFDAATNATLDPIEPQSNSSVSQAALLAIYNSLVRLSDAGEPLPGLAKAWSYNNDLTEFTLTLRPGVTFHDGAKLDAAAVVANLKRSIELGTRAGASTQEITSRIAGVTANGDDTVVIRLKDPNGQLPFLLAMQPGMMISPASLSGGAFGGTLKAVGAGPYRVRQFEAAMRTTMDRFDHYWGGTEGRPAAMIQQYVPDGRARLNAVRSGQATLVLLDTRQIEEAKSAGLTVQVNERNTISDLYINTSRDTTGKVKVRQALMHAIDRAALAEALGGGVAKPTAQLFSATSRMYDPALEKLFPFDPARARQLLTEAGFPNGVDINWLMSNTSETRLVAEAMQAMVAESGFRMKFDVVDISQYVLFRRPPTRGDIYLGRWGGRADPLQVFQEVASSDGSVNAGGAASPEIDALIGKARAMRLDDPAREAILHQLSRLTTELVSHVALMTRPNIYAFRKGCILHLTSYLPTGSDRFNDVQVGKACK